MSGIVVLVDISLPRYDSSKQAELLQLSLFLVGALSTLCSSIARPMGDSNEKPQTRSFTPELERPRDQPGCLRTCACIRTGEMPRATFWQHDHDGLGESGYVYIFTSEDVNR